MSVLSLFMIGVILMTIIIYALIQYVLNERQLCKPKYAFYVSLVMLFAIILPPIFFFLRPRNALNIRLSARIFNGIFRLLGLQYCVENAQVLNKDEPCVIVANHQSSVDFIDMMHI